jgi:hypothetical protein
MIADPTQLRRRWLLLIAFGVSMLANPIYEADLAWAARAHHSMAAVWLIALDKVVVFGTLALYCSANRPLKWRMFWDGVLICVIVIQGACLLPDVALLFS